jgi:hypothetical protein
VKAEDLQVVVEKGATTKSSHLSEAETSPALSPSSIKKIAAQVKVAAQLFELDTGFVCSKQTKVAYRPHIDTQMFRG